MEALDNYNKSQEEIYNYFGFKEGCRVFPIDDCRDYWWKMNDTDVYFFDSQEAYSKQDLDHYYHNKILHLHSYPTAVYEGAEYTMIMVDTKTDGNKYLAIFHNLKKYTDGCV